MENVSMCLLSTIQRSITSSTMHMRKPRLCVFECLPKVGQLTTGVRREPRQSDFAGRTRTSCTLPAPRTYPPALVPDFSAAASSRYTETTPTSPATRSQLWLNLVKWLLNLLWNFYKMWKANTKFWQTKLLVFLSFLLPPQRHTLEPHIF